MYMYVKWSNITIGWGHFYNNNWSWLITLKSKAFTFCPLTTRWGHCNYQENLVQHQHMTEMQAWVFYPLISRLPISPLHLHVWHALHLLHVLLGCLFGCIVIFSNYLVPSFLGGAKAALGSCCTKIFWSSRLWISSEEKKYQGALCICFCLAI